MTFTNSFIFISVLPSINISTVSAIIFNICPLSSSWHHIIIGASTVSTISKVRQAHIAIAWHLFLMAFTNIYIFISDLPSINISTVSIIIFNLRHLSSSWHHIIVGTSTISTISKEVRQAHIIIAWHPFLLAFTNIYIFISGLPSINSSTVSVIIVHIHNLLSSWHHIIVGTLKISKVHQAHIAIAWHTIHNGIH